jgi:phospholipase/carboxylesterase
MKLTDWRLEQDHEVVYRISSPQGDRQPIALLLHGRTGDESSMGVFASTLPNRYLTVCPRGLLSDPEGGYTWLPQFPNSYWPNLRDFHQPVATLTVLLDSIRERHLARVDQMIVIGFSQGAALACAFALSAPAQVGALVLLSGFVPEITNGRRAEHGLRDMPVFVAHGIQDRLIPIALAEKGVNSLEELGGRVELCTTPVGHKVGGGCLRALREWLAHLSL